MITRSRRVITGLLSDDQPPAAGLSDGIARGLSVNEAGASPSGVTVFQFKQAIRQYSSPTTLRKPSDLSGMRLCLFVAVVSATSVTAYVLHDNKWPSATMTFNVDIPSDDGFVEYGLRAGDGPLECCNDFRFQDTPRYLRGPLRRPRFRERSWVRRRPLRRGRFW